jgi:hypothetical protein
MKNEIINGVQGRSVPFAVAAAGRQGLRNPMRKTAATKRKMRRKRIPFLRFFPAVPLSLILPATGCQTLSRAEAFCCEGGSKWVKPDDLGQTATQIYVNI